MPAWHDIGKPELPQAHLITSSGNSSRQQREGDDHAHPACELPVICGTQIEITLPLQGTPYPIVERRRGRCLQSTKVRSGTLWLKPTGCQNQAIRIIEPLPGILHLYLPEHLPHPGAGEPHNAAADAMMYLADVQDPVIRQICTRILQEMRFESGADDLLLEHLTLTLALHLEQNYSRSVLAAPQGNDRGGLSPSRRRRVIDYIEDNLEGDFTVAELADVACLSRHHFARSFKAALGQSPSDYVAARRLMHGRTLLADPGLSLADIAARCRFSSQAVFGRAFRRQVGMSPGEYRRRLR
jgi:AraC family transcriptional regulator